MDVLGTLLRGELAEFSQQGVPRAVLRMRGHAGHRRVSAVQPLFPGVWEQPPPPPPGARHSPGSGHRQSR